MKNKKYKYTALKANNRYIIWRYTDIKDNKFINLRHLNPKTFEWEFIIYKENYVRHNEISLTEAEVTSLILQDKLYRM